jgi:orotidine-5'-phosphate decarboxylase
MSFLQRMQAAWTASGSTLCVGLDPAPGKLPPSLQGKPLAILDFCTAIVDATADLVCAFKPQIAYFAAARAEEQLEALCAYIKTTYPQVILVLDAKRGDIGATAEQYAVEAYERYQADAVTVNPYLGTDSVTPFLDHRDRGVFVLCRTSNPGGDDFQNLDVAGRPLFEAVAERVAGHWNAAGQCGLVVGATYPRELRRVRQIVGDGMPLLIPGVGAQGGDAVETARSGGTHIVVNSSRAILYASAGEDFAEAARAVAQATRSELGGR